MHNYKIQSATHTYNQLKTSANIKKQVHASAHSLNRALSHTSFYTHTCCLSTPIHGDFLLLA